MFALNKRQPFETAGDLISILSKVSPDTPITICGDNYCFYHEEQDGSGICLDCEDLSENYDEEERPLTLFLREEVPYRLQEVLDLPNNLVTDELIQTCVAELGENSELMFNHDKIDELLRSVLRKRGIDADALETEKRKDGE